MSSRGSPHAVCATLENGAVVLHMVTKRYFTLNESGAFIWGLLEQGHPTAEIIHRICEAFTVSAGEAAASLQRLVSELEGEQLLAEAR